MDNLEPATNHRDDYSPLCQTALEVFKGKTASIRTEMIMDCYHSAQATDTPMHQMWDCHTAACRRSRSARVTLSFSFSFVVALSLWFCIRRFCQATEGKELLFVFEVANSRSFLHISRIQRAYKIVLQRFIFAWEREAAWSFAYSLVNLISQQLGDAAEE